MRQQKLTYWAMSVWGLAEITDHCDAGQHERPEGDRAVGGVDSGGQSGHCRQDPQEESQTQGEPRADFW